MQTGSFWGSHPTAAQLAAYLERGDLEAGPPADWSVGHFVGLLGLDEGRAGALVTVADTYPAIGLGGVHLQPVEAVASALAGRGVLVIAEPDVARSAWRKPRVAPASCGTTAARSAAAGSAARGG